MKNGIDDISESLDLYQNSLSLNMTEEMSSHMDAFEQTFNENIEELKTAKYTDCYKNYQKDVKALKNNTTVEYDSCLKENENEIKFIVKDAKSKTEELKEQVEKLKKDLKGCGTEFSSIVCIQKLNKAIQTTRNDIELKLKEVPPSDVLVEINDVFKKYVENCVLGKFHRILVAEASKNYQKIVECLLKDQPNEQKVGSNFL